MKVLKIPLFGTTEEHLSAMPHNPTMKIHCAIQKDWERLVLKAREEGIHLKAISSFRSFEAQKNIWNLKATGKRDLLDDQENIIPFNHFDLNDHHSKIELIHTILRWSALPGLSRHHWGTDLDIVDQRKLDQNPDYKVSLIPSEYSAGGIFEELGYFLNERLQETSFFRPYDIDRGGIAPEPWHISHRELAQEFLQKLTSDFYLQFISNHKGDIHLYEEIISEIDEIFSRYIFNVSE